MDGRRGGIRIRGPIRSAGWIFALLLVGCLGLVGWSFTLSGVDASLLFLGVFLVGLFGSAVCALGAAGFLTEPPLGIPRAASFDGAFRDARGRAILAPEAITGADAFVSPNDCILHIYDRQLHRHVVRVADPRVGREIIARVRQPGGGVSRFTTSALLSTQEIALGLLLLMGGVVLLTRIAQPPVLVPLGVVLVCVAGLATRTRIFIGRDGVHLRWLTRARFYAVGDITRAEARSDGVTIHLRDGSCSLSMGAVEALRLEARLNASLASREAGSSDLEPRLARGDRAIDAWIDDLRKLLREPSYRVAAASATMLAQIVDDVRRGAADRVAAAVALATSDDGRARVRVAARGTADPELRAALEQIADDERPSASLVARIAER